MRLACRFPAYFEFAGTVRRDIRDRMGTISEDGGSWFVEEVLAWDVSFSRRLCEGQNP